SPPARCRCTPDSPSPRWGEGKPNDELHAPAVHPRAERPAHLPRPPRRSRPRALALDLLERLGRGAADYRAAVVRGQPQRRQGRPRGGPEFGEPGGRPEAPPLVGEAQPPQQPRVLTHLSLAVPKSPVSNTGSRTFTKRPVRRRYSSYFRSSST